MAKTIPRFPIKDPQSGFFFVRPRFVQYHQEEYDALVREHGDPLSLPDGGSVTWPTIKVSITKYVVDTAKRSGIHVTAKTTGTLGNRSTVFTCRGRWVRRSA